MDFQPLEVLEEKIKKLLSTTKALRAENEQLTRKNEENEKAIHKLRLDLQKWSRSAEENHSLLEELATLKKEREEIKTKLERLISHLEELETKI